MAPQEPRTSGHIDWPNVFCHMPFINLSAGHHRFQFCCYATSKWQNSYFEGDNISLMDLWNDPLFVEAREHMYAGRAHVVCKPTCPHLKSGGVKNNFLGD